MLLDRWRHVEIAVLWLVGREGLEAHACGNTLHVLLLKMRLAFVFALRQSDVERLRRDDAPVHLRDSFGGLLRAREANEAETFRSRAVFFRFFATFCGRSCCLGASLDFCVCHNFSGRDVSVRREVLPQDVVGDAVVEIFNVEVDALVALVSLVLQLLEFDFELRLALGLLLCSSDEDLLSFKLFVVEVLNCFLGALVRLVRDESKLS